MTRVMAIDPGAKRCGYAVLEQDKEPKRKASGILGVAREEQELYQPYRLRVIEFWAEKGAELLDQFQPDVVVGEIVPVRGGGQFASAGQSHLAATALTSLQTLAYLKGYRVEQIGATTVKKRIGGSSKATKARVRRGVMSTFPELGPLEKEWKKSGWSDESDAIAIALAFLEGEAQC